MSSQPPKQKVIGLGLGRTGTSSLRDALELLGFGPSYHTSIVIRNQRVDDFKFWQKVGAGSASSDELRQFLEPYGSVVDYMPAIYATAMYTAYPDAKFILTTRDPEKWEKSMKDTLLKGQESLSQDIDKTPLQQAQWEWISTDLYRYHGGRLETNPQKELFDHNERVKHMIPAEQLLVYDVSEGWDKLAEFLGVPVPTVPFPHLNDTAQFLQRKKNRAAAKKAALDQSQNRGSL